MLCSFRIPCWNAPGCNRGRETMVRIESIVCGGKWTWLNVVVIVAVKIRLAVNRCPSWVWRAKITCVDNAPQ